MQGIYKPLNLGLRGTSDALSLVNRYVNHPSLNHASDIALGLRCSGFALLTLVNFSKLICSEKGLDGRPTCESVKKNKRSFRQKVVLQTTLGVVQCLWFTSYLVGKRLSPHSWVNRFAEETGSFGTALLLISGFLQLANRSLDTAWDDTPFITKTTGALVFDLFQTYNAKKPLPFINALPVQQITGLTSVGLQLWSWATKTT